MGHKQKDKYHKSIGQTINDRLKNMLEAGIGHSKHKDRETGLDRDRIYSFSTYKTYKRWGKYFAAYMFMHHTDITSMKKAKKYVKEYLQTLVNAERSAWTIQTAAKAIGKIFAINKDDKDYFDPPIRRREDIKRSRLRVENDKHFSEAKNAELVKFCRATGLRREGMTRIRGKDLWTRETIENEIKRISKIDPDKRTDSDKIMLRVCEDTLYFTHNEKYFIFVREKGGRVRFAPVIGPDADSVADRFRTRKPDEKIWQHISKHADIHGYRAEYATLLYREYARRYIQ